RAEYPIAMSALAPYTTLFRSVPRRGHRVGGAVGVVAAAQDPHRGVGEVGGPVRPGQHQAAAPLACRGALEEVEGVGHHPGVQDRSEEHTSELESRDNLVCRLL